jgi:hypothetical protein
VRMVPERPFSPWSWAAARSSWFDCARARSP